MVEATEASAKVLADVAAEKRRGAESAVLRDVRKLVGEEAASVRRAAVHADRRGPREEDAPPEDDRARARECRQKRREPSAMEPGARELGSKLRFQLPGEDRRDPGH